MTEALKRPCFLIVENHVLIRNLICTVLNNDGHLALAAANDAEALEISRTFGGEIRILITKDAVLARTIGGQRRDIHVILLSAGMSSALREIVQAVRPNAFQNVELPRELRDCIHRALTDAGSEERVQGDPRRPGGPPHK